MFIMKTELLISLLCVTLSVSAAAVVPVEDVVPEERAVPVSVEDVVPEERADVSVPVVAEADVKEEEDELAVSDDTVGISMENPLQDNTPRDVPLPFIRDRTASSCPQGWHQYQNNCYQLVNLPYSRMNAEFQCEKMGSNLASAHNLWEYSFLQQLTWKAGFLTAWIGGYKFLGYWRWDDGTPFDYNNWHSHSTSSYDNCVYLNSQNTLGWTSDECQHLHPFICSFKLNC